MQIIRETRACLDEAQLPLDYRLFLSSGGEPRQYGVQVTREDTGETASVENVTQDQFTAMVLLHLLARHRVTPVTLRDVVADFLVETEFVD